MEREIRIKEARKNKERTPRAYLHREQGGVLVYLRDAEKSG